MPDTFVVGFRGFIYGPHGKFPCLRFCTASETVKPRDGAKFGFMLCVHARVLEESAAT